jgi:hypothetical protein
VKRHQELLTAAIEREATAQEALFRHDGEAARAAFAEASALYRSSWEEAPPTSYGRLVGMLKAGVLAGQGQSQAEYTRSELGSQDAESPTAAYAQVLAAVIVRDAPAAERWSDSMRSGGEAFARTADALRALATEDRAGYEAALEAIVADFEARQEHLTGVAIADTALMLQRLAAARDMDAELESPTLPD